MISRLLLISFLSLAMLRVNLSLATDFDVENGYLSSVHCDACANLQIRTRFSRQSNYYLSPLLSI